METASTDGIRRSPGSEVPERGGGRLPIRIAMDLHRPLLPAAHTVIPGRPSVTIDPATLARRCSTAGECRDGPDPASGAPCVCGEVADSGVVAPTRAARTVPPGGRRNAEGTSSEEGPRGDTPGAAAGLAGAVMALWRSGALALWRSGALALWRSGALALWRSGALALWRSGALALWRSGALALSIITSVRIRTVKSEAPTPAQRNLSPHAATGRRRTDRSCTRARPA